MQQDLLFCIDSSNFFCRTILSRQQLFQESQEHIQSQFEDVHAAINKIRVDAKLSDETIGVLKSSTLEDYYEELL